MKILLPGLLLFIGLTQLNAQNLVTNYSLENYSSCPNLPGQLAKATGWFSSTNSPDYYNACANTTTPHVGVPENITGFQNASTGNAYAGILCYGSFASNLLINAREYATGTLSQPLTVGVKYFVSLKVALMNASSHAIDHIGAKFLMTQAFPVAITNNAHVYTTAVITDTLNWQTIQGSFIADSSYSFISIGNFFSDSNTTVLSVQPVTYGYNAYYYVEDVCVSTDSLTCVLPVGVNDPQDDNIIGIYPNPFAGLLHVTALENELMEISIYDLASRKILQQSFTNSVSINTEFLSRGIYLYKISNDSGIIKNGKLIKQ